MAHCNSNEVLIVGGVGCKYSILVIIHVYIMYIHVVTLV